MPSTTHNAFLYSLTDEIWDQLKALTTSVEEAQNAKPMPWGFEFPGLKKKYPDGAFGSREKKYPRLVIEIANSQSRKNLNDLAYTYIQASKGRIRTVLAVDLEYRPPAKRSMGHISNAVYSIYRLHIETGPDGRTVRRVKVDVENRPFRFDGDTPDGNLVLKLSDVLSISPSADINDPTISISHNDLTAFLAEAEAYQAIADSPTNPHCSEDEMVEGFPDATSQHVSEPEEVTAEDMMAFQKQVDASEQMRDER